MKRVHFSAVFSVVIELLQLFFEKGLFEFDDIFHNTIGGIIGLLLYGRLVQIIILERIK